MKITRNKHNDLVRMGDMEYGDVFCTVVDSRPCIFTDDTSTSLCYLETGFLGVVDLDEMVFRLDCELVIQ